jgi:fused signal recognition particle receptor
VTKIDGSAKGGVALAIEKSSGIPIKFIGSGEELEDFKLFDPSTYIAGLFE